MGVVLKAENVAIRYITGDFKDIGIKEYTVRRLTNNYHVNEFMAVDGVSFELEEGDMLGIIGSNGAGKSTLLKAVAGIMEPTRGHIEANGEVVALLELGSGFDGDLTVKENAYLRGAMLGYTREFMDETYDQIIDFAELREFEDRPFKQLSSGMKSRLAFSIASLVQPDILVLDDVLSVGDGAFKEKSAKKMREIISNGAVTILVSHSLDQVRELCNKVLWIDHGKQIAFGDMEEICDYYEGFLKGEYQLPNTIKLDCDEKTEYPYNPELQTKSTDIIQKKKNNLLFTLFILCVFVIVIKNIGGNVNSKLISYWEITLKVLMCVGLAHCIWRLNRQKKIIFVMVMSISASVFAAGINRFTPQLTDSVIVTAMGEQNPLSQGNEVMLCGFRVNEVDIKIGLPEEGKWFWGGEQYMWRNESDMRQPDGTTRQIVLTIPNGSDRQIRLRTGPWNGYVQIECLDQQITLDTYSENYDLLDVKLPSSSVLTLIRQAVLNTLLFCGILLFVLLLSRFILLKAAEEELYWEHFLKKNLAYVLCAVISIFMFLLMVITSTGEKFWNDEVYQIAFCMNKENVLQQLLITHSGYYPSLADPLFKGWYRFSPYGEKWLLLPTEFATALGVYLLSTAIYRLKGIQSAILTAVFGSISVNLIFQCGREFRGYGFLFLACCIALSTYMFHSKCMKIRWKDILLYGVGLWLPTAFHVFGVFFSAGLVITDFGYMCIKKIDRKWFVSYVIAVILYLPWLYNMICYDVLDYEATWQGTPSIKAVNSLLRYLTSYDNIQFLLMMVGILSIGYQVWKRTGNQHEIQIVDLACVITMCFVIGFAYAYGSWINQDATMWVERYFIVLFPCIIYSEVAGVEFLCNGNRGEKLVRILCIVLLFYSGVETLLRIKEPSPNDYQSFREAANWLYDQQNTIYNDDVMILYTPDAPASAWQEYYLTRQGLRDPLEVVEQYHLTPECLTNKSIIYVYYEHIGFPECTRDLLEEYGFHEQSNEEQLKICTFARE